MHNNLHDKSRAAFPSPFDPMLSTNVSDLHSLLKGEVWVCVPRVCTLTTLMVCTIRDREKTAGDTISNWNEPPGDWVLAARLLLSRCQSWRTCHQRSWPRTHTLIPHSLPHICPSDYVFSRAYEHHHTRCVQEAHSRIHWGRRARCSVCFQTVRELTHTTSLRHSGQLMPCC